MREIRRAHEADLAALPAIEAEADELFEEIFGPNPFGPTSAEDGSARAAQPGFLLAAAEEPDDPAIGFAHVLEPEEIVQRGIAHLEQLAVLPSRGRRGHGRALVEAACEEAHRRGASVITLRTYAEVPWNAPFYRACGFTEIPPMDTEFHRQRIRDEERAALDRHGPRVLLARHLDGL